MSNPTEQSPRFRYGRLVVVGLFALFFVPIVTAYVLNVAFTGWRPFGHTNHGTLVDPPIRVEERGLTTVAGPPFPGGTVFASRWSLVVRTGDVCVGTCETALYRTRQTRLALGKDAHRIQRLLIASRPVPATTLERILPGQPDLQVLVANPRWRLGDEPSQSALGRVFLVDPQGYLVLVYDADSNPEGILQDLKRLLRISKIG